MSRIGQVGEFVGELMKRTPWGEILLKPLIDDIATVAPEFVLFLQNGGRVIVQQRVFRLWRTVVLGRHHTPEAYLASIRTRGRKISPWAKGMATRVVCSQEQVDLPLVDVLDRDLGFTKVYTPREFYVQAATFGLYPCPAEAGLALADQLDDQSVGDSRRIAMEAIATSVIDLDIFCLGHEEFGSLLRTVPGHPETRVNPGNRWVLTTRKP
ncbi:MAG: hypothetical protein NUV84_00130 [Candidatus Uhrbacteria bacterium]|nr:hypothetical protein [Candidatus Uhrbacteria bacterium]